MLYDTLEQFFPNWIRQSFRICDNSPPHSRISLVSLLKREREEERKGVSPKNPS